MPAQHSHHKSAVFFDMDGTLHKQDAFLSFGIAIAKRRWLLTLLLFPVVLIGVVIYAIFPNRKIGIDIVLLAILFGLNQNKLNGYIKDFASDFRRSYSPFGQIYNALLDYQHKSHEVFIITGTLTPIAQAIYPELNADNIHWLGSELCHTKYFSFLEYRCYGKNKLALLNHYLATHELDNIRFVAGFSDSKADLPIMTLCQTQYWIDKEGNIR